MERLRRCKLPRPVIHRTIGSKTVYCMGSGIRSATAAAAVAMFRRDPFLFEGPWETGRHCRVLGSSLETSEVVVGRGMDGLAARNAAKKRSVA